MAQYSFMTSSTVTNSRRRWMSLITGYSGPTIVLTILTLAAGLPFLLVRDTAASIPAYFYILYYGLLSIVSGAHAITWILRMARQEFAVRTKQESLPANLPLLFPEFPAPHEESAAEEIRQSLRNVHEVLEQSRRNIHELLEEMSERLRQMRPRSLSTAMRQRGQRD